MEGCVGSQIESMGSMARKKRSNTCRRPRCEPFIDKRDISLLSPAPTSEYMRKGFSKENSSHDTFSQEKQLNMDHCASNISSIKKGGSEASSENRKDDTVLEEFDAFNRNSASKGSDLRQSSDLKRCNKGYVSATHIIKLKVGGVTRTIHGNPMPNGASTGVLLSTNSPHCSDTPRFGQNPFPQETWDDEHPSSKRTSVLQGVPGFDFCGRGVSPGKDHLSGDSMSRDSLAWMKADKSGSVRKKKRGPRRQARMLDEAFDDEEEDEEIRYLERLRISKISTDWNAKSEENGEGSRNQQKIPKDSKSRLVDGEDVDYGSFESNRDGKNKSKSERVSDNRDLEEEEPALDGETVKREMTLTSRQRALLSGKDGGASTIEFPNGLPPPQSRKQKEKLSEVEQQLKKVEAAQRRKMQVEKANKEAQDEAIRKILGQDSGRKKQEDKMKKRRDKLAQERAANANRLPPNTIRWVSGPNGDVLTFSDDIGLPSLFHSMPPSYPLPREKCAGPTCSNPYKYRDSKTNLPLCSLQCYKSIHAQEPA